MDFQPPLSAAFEFLLAVERLYASLIAAAPDSGLGGKLLYIGVLGEEGRPLAAAANIAGAASLAVIPGTAAGKQAMREGIVDFLVSDLDEALRILKNQLRKHEPAAVCVASAPDLLEAEMFDRGVLPDLLGPAVPHVAAARWPASPRIAPLAPGRLLVAGEVLIAWSVAAAPALWLPRMDALAAECLPPDAASARRWLRLAPRYTGRLAQGVRLLRCPAAVAQTIFDRASAEADLRANVELQLSRPACT